MFRLFLCVKYCRLACFIWSDDVFSVYLTVSLTYNALSMNVNDPIYDYVHMVAFECAPDVDFDENGEPFLWGSTVGNDVIRRFDKLEFPFTKEEYYSNTDVLDVLEAYEIDIEKFWYAILFIYHFTKSKIADGIKVSPKNIDLIHSLLDYLKNGEKVVLTVTAENKKQNLTIKEKLALGAVADVIEAAIPYLQEERTMNFQALNIGEKAKVGTKASSQIAYATARYQALFEDLELERRRAKHTKAVVLDDEFGREVNNGKTDDLSFNRKLLISRLMYFSCFTENDKFLHSEENLNGILKDYKDIEINTASREYLY